MVFAYLKQQTSHSHTHLEETIDILKRMQTAHHYQGVLEAFYGFYRPLEAHLGTVPGIESVDFQARRKTALLRDDLRALGLSDAEIDHLPVCTHLPRVSSLVEAAGCLYVLEGATLGGQIISRHIQKLSHTLPHAFFTAYGPQTGRQWKALQDVVEQRFDDAHLHDVMAQAAQETFITLERWFQSQMHL
jgi:heme oxygenase (biliverdin-IX-beta and delta-forming)